MKAVMLLTLIGLASCRITLAKDGDRDIEVKYSFDDDYDRGVVVDFVDRPAKILRPVLAPVVQSRPVDPVHQFVQVKAAPAPQFRTRVVEVEPPRPAFAQVIAETAPVQVVASRPQIYTQEHQIVPVAAPVAPQVPVFVLENTAPVVSVPRSPNVVTQFVNAEAVPVGTSVVASTSFVKPQVSAPLIAAGPSVPIVTPPRSTFVAERRHVFKPKDDSSEE